MRVDPQVLVGSFIWMDHKNGTYVFACAIKDKPRKCALADVPCLSGANASTVISSVQLLKLGSQGVLVVDWDSMGQLNHRSWICFSGAENLGGTISSRFAHGVLDLLALTLRDS